MSYLKAQDTISGKEGKAVATIDGNVEDMFYIKKIEANVEKTKSEIKTLGRRGTQHKATGWSGTGSMTILLYYHKLQKANDQLYAKRYRYLFRYTGYK